MAASQCATAQAGAASAREVEVEEEEYDDTYKTGYYGEGTYVDG